MAGGDDDDDDDDGDDDDDDDDVDVDDLSVLEDMWLHPDNESDNETWEWRHVPCEHFCY